jgi:HSP20 family protein
VDKKDIKVEVQGDQLIVHGESKKESKFESENYIRRERSSGQFKRSVTLPRECDQQNIQAKFENGLLEVRIPKRVTEAQQQRKTITVA